MKGYAEPLATVQPPAREATPAVLTRTSGQRQVEATHCRVRSDDENFRGQAALNLITQLADLRRQSEQLWAEHLKVYQLSFEERAIAAEHRWRSEHPREE